MDTKKKALIKFLGLTTKDEIKEIENDSYNDNVFYYSTEEYEVLTDSEADERWDEELELYIDECILPELPDFASQYFDREAWKRDAEFDGRGHAISRYDGEENEQTVNGTTFYIYRQN
jgi:hypothetical protein